MNFKYPPHYITVCGLGRCGTSATMQMLEAGGIPCLSTYPAYEQGLEPRKVPVDALKAKGPCAVKILEPQYSKWPADMPRRVIWLDRDYVEQARSTCRFIGVPETRHAVRALAVSFRQDMYKCISQLKDWPMIRIHFEDLVANPKAIADRIKTLIDGSWSFDTDKAAMTIIRRGPEAQKTLWVEARLLEQANG